MTQREMLSSPLGLLAPPGLIALSPGSRGNRCIFGLSAVTGEDIYDALTCRLDWTADNLGQRLEESFNGLPLIDSRPRAQRPTHTPPAGIHTRCRVGARKWLRTPTRGVWRSTDHEVGVRVPPSVPRDPCSTSPCVANASGRRLVEPSDGGAWVPLETSRCTRRSCRSVSRRRVRFRCGGSSIPEIRHGQGGGAPSRLLSTWLPW